MEEPVETELKLEISKQEVDLIKKKLGHFLGKEVRQETIMFDNAEGIMNRTDGRVRLRKEGDIASVSYKRPLPSIDKEKKEVEFETTIGSVGILTNIFQMMGYTPTTSYEKNVWKTHHNGVVVEIQEYPFATFLEIEGSKEDIDKVAQELEIDTKNTLKKPVDTLFSEWRERKGLPFKAYMRFNDYDR